MGTPLFNGGLYERVPFFVYVACVAGVERGKLDSGELKGRG